MDIEKRDYSFKKYIYVSTKVRSNMEEILKENKIMQINRFINTYDVDMFFRQELRNINGVNFLILDLDSFPSSKDSEIITALKLLREKYEARIIIIAEGHKQGDIILGKIFNLGIYNIITSKDSIDFENQFRKTISLEGMTFGNSMKYQIEDLTLNIGSNKTVIKENYVKVKQVVNIGIASCERHQGATSLAMNLTKFLNSYDNITACYIENNNHKTVEQLENLKNAVYLENKKMISYDKLDFYLKPDNIAEIQKYDYSFYIYDFGAFCEMSEEMKNNFISRDLKLIVSRI